MEVQKIQWSKDKNDPQTLQKIKDRAKRTPLKTRGELWVLRKGEKLKSTSFNMRKRTPLKTGSELGVLRKDEK
jgi:hypothetical protein